MARDLGAVLGVGGLVQTLLRRTHVGPFTADSGLKLDASAEVARTKLRPAGEAVADLPRSARRTPATAARFRQGQAIPWAGRGAVAVFRRHRTGRAWARRRPAGCGRR